MAATTVAGHPRNKMKYSNIMSYVQIVFPNLYQFTTGIILVATTVAGQGTWNMLAIKLFSFKGKASGSELKYIDMLCWLIRE